MPRRTRRMHTVPAGYLFGFRDASANRKKSQVWRFERRGKGPTPIGVRDASVSNDIYLLRDTATMPATFVEKNLLAESVEQAFPSVVASFDSRATPSHWQWRCVSRFMAFQFWRTPRMFQLLRDEWARLEIKAGVDDPQMAMASIAPMTEYWLCCLKWRACFNQSDFPFLTSDNPVVTWVSSGEGIEGGVGFHNPNLRVLFPLTPRLCLHAIQTPESLRRIIAGPPGREARFDKPYGGLDLEFRNLGIKGATMLNQVLVGNADRYIYSNSAEGNGKLRLFLTDTFFGHPAPVRRTDRKPIGSPAA